MAWFNSNWDFRKAITIDSAQVDVSLSDFPVFVEILGDSDLANDAQSSGDDILFTADDGATQLDHEIQGFDSANGDLYAHVEVPSLSASSDTTIYLYYGNSGASDQQNVAGTWSSDFVAVHHLNESASGTGTADVYEDSTGANHDGNDQVSATNKDGQVFEGQNFDGSDDYIPVPYDTDFDLNTFSISVWFRTSVSNNSDIKTLSNKEDPSGQFNNRNWWVALDNGQGFSGTDGAIALRTSSGGSTISISSNSDHRDGNWHHAFAIFDPSGNDEAELWIDGTEVARQDGVGSPDTQNADVLIGSENNTSLPYRTWDGNLDDHLVYNSAKSSGYITTLYKNQSDPGTFFSVGNEETETATITVPTQTATASTPAPATFFEGAVFDWTFPQAFAHPSQAAAVAAPTASADAQTPAPSIGGAGTATVESPTASATGTTPTPTVTGTAAAAITAPTAAADAETPAPAITPTTAAVVATPIASSGGQTPTPTVTTGAATVVVPVAAAAGQTPTPTVTGAGATAVTVPTATSAADTPEPAIATGGQFISVPTASSDGQTPVPAVTASGAATIAVPTASSTGQTPAVTLVVTGAAAVAVPTAVAAGVTPAPTVAQGEPITRSLATTVTDRRDRTTTVTDRRDRITTVTDRRDRTTTADIQSNS